MKTSLLKSLDGVLCRSLCQVASALPRPRRQVKAETLIIRPGGMGDLICADIAMGNLGLNSHSFTWLIEARSRPWAEYRGLPHFCYDDHPIRTLRKVWHRYDLVINTEQLYGFAEAYALLALAHAGRLTSLQTNRGSRWSYGTVAYDWRDEHETVAFARLFAKSLGCPDAVESLRLRTRIYSPSEPPLVLIAGRQSPSRRLSLEDWVALIARWQQGRIFLVGSAPEDAEFADQVVASFPDKARRLTCSFPHLCEQIALSEEIFTMDGGAVHIASYFGVPTLALFTSGRAHKWSPLGEGSRILRRHDLACQPCTKFGQVPPCPHAYACLQMEDLMPVNVTVNQAD